MTLNVLGLVLDIVGVILLWKFGLPENIDRGGATYLISNDVNKPEKKKAKFYDAMSTFALVLLVFGFVLQIIYALQL